MTDKQRRAKLKAGIAELKKTTRGYKQSPTGVHWRRGLARLEAVADDLAATPQPKVPQLGPVVRGGTPILEQDLTHATGGVPNHPAFDDAVGKPGIGVIAPEPITIDRIGSSVRRDGNPNGRSVHASGASGIHYWFGHLSDPLPPGTKVKKGQRFASISANHEAPHVHVGVDARRLIGRDLTHHTDYTHGAPKVGAQLRKALS